jgi:hypothetical protein
MATNLTPVETRAQDPTFVARCSLNGLRDRLPLRWPTPPDTPPSPKRAYRSDYTYLGWEDLQDLTSWQHLSDFELLLRLVDFSGLRPVLAQRLGWTSGRGWKPFDPVSMFLLVAWQIINAWTRTDTLDNVRKPRYADYAQRFGFHDGIFPTEGGVRYFLTALGQHSEAAGELIVVDQDQAMGVAVQHLNQLLVQSVALMRHADVISPEAWSHALVCLDGMLHPAASRLRCASVTDTCYQPTTPAAPRPCPAKDKGREGCRCDTPVCATVCQHAPVRDPQARFVWHSATNQSKSNPNQPTDSASAQPKRGTAVFGYGSLRLQLADPARRFSVVLLADFGSANRPEDDAGAALLLQLHPNYPDLHLDAVAGDAAYGHDRPLSVIYRLQARRVIDLRAHQTDADKSQWPVRGYDDRGRPVCSFGYAFSSNGFDYERQRHKWVCAQACCRDVEPLVKIPDVVYPPLECPYRSPDCPHGRVLNIADRFADGSIRLARDVPVGSPAWKRLYHRARNAVESRHSIFEGWDLKRMPVYGLLRSKAISFLTDFWGNLMTLARLIREATAATGA